MRKTLVTSYFCNFTMKLLVIFVATIIISITPIVALLIFIYQSQDTFKLYPIEEQAEENGFFTLLPYGASCALDPPDHPVIHFLEGYGHAALTSRMWCAVEAACAANPNSSVVVHMKAGKLLWTAQAVALLKKFDNLRVVSLEEPEIFLQSPLRSWYEEQKWRQSPWAVSHFNDAVRWLIMFHYGGLYLDMDSISVRSLTPPGFVTPNFVGMESNQWLGAGVIRLNTSRHWLPAAILQSLAASFDPSEWGAMGPKLLTRIVCERCNFQMPDVASSECDDFSILPVEAFHIVPWWSYRLFVNPDKGYRLSSRLMSDSQVLVVHTWNHLTENIPVPLNKPPSVVYRGDPETNRVISREALDLGNIPSTEDKKLYFSPYAMIAKKVCPLTVSLAGELL